MLKARVLAALVGLPVVIFALLGGRVTLTALAAIVGVTAAVELTAMARGMGYPVPYWSGLVPVLVALATITFSSQPVSQLPANIAVAWLAVLAAAIAGSVIFNRAEPELLVSLGVIAALTSVYIAWPVALWPLLYDLVPGSTQGRPWVLAAFPLVVTWVGDTGAYFGGRWLGKRSLAPELSPAKTVEGALMGLLAAVGAALLMSGWLPWRLPLAVTAGALVGAMGQIGDLWESGLKRMAGVKDSGAWIPGHGGVLDRFDGLFFAIPVTFYLAMSVI